MRASWNKTKMLRHFKGGASTSVSWSMVMENMHMSVVLLCVLALGLAFCGLSSASIRYETSNELRKNKSTLSEHLHPNLFFDQTDVSLMKKRANHAHRRIFQVIRNAVLIMLSKPGVYQPPVKHEDFARKWNEIYGNNLPPLALYCLLQPQDAAASQFLIEYMDRMVEYPNWMVSSAPNDEVPTAHTLTGFATAYDFIYTFLDTQRRLRYLKKIQSVTEELFELSKHREWGNQFLQNRQTTNILAILIGALVVGQHNYTETMIWKQISVNYLEKTMFLLSHIVDGSLDEGVAYGSYTAKSITQYVYLALRHFQIDNTQNPWLKAHFMFYFATLLPGFQRTVGIADSNYNWFYGPESQLLFLDTYVLRNGSGNWLAEQIRKHRPKDGPMMQSSSRHWATLHTEFIWYNSELTPQPPPQFNQATMHVFTNWGVVTFGAGLPQAEGNTFVSFKSGKLGGRAVYDIIHTKAYSWLDGWMNFNPGHEHPDQNSFTFAPNGKVFVSEALYGPKYSYLNNVLVFGPSSTSQCNQPWEGQLGECSKWLQWGDKDVGDTAGEIVAASSHNNMLFVSGESVSAYSSSMKLKSVYRALVLLNFQTLLVLDHIEKQKNSPLSFVSAFFHNLDIDFRYVPHKSFGKYNGALMDVWDAHYKMFWLDTQGSSPVARIQEAEQEAEFKKRWTQFINVTFPLQNPTTRVAYLMHGPYVTVSEFKFIESSKNGVRISLMLNGTVTLVSIATNYEDIKARHDYLGFPGFAKTEDNQSIVHFGKGSRSMPGQVRKEVGIDFRLLLKIFAGFTICFVWTLIKKRKMASLFNLMVIFLLTCLLLLWVTGISHVFYGCEQFLFSVQTKDNTQCDGSDSYVAGLPITVIMSVPGSGAEILQALFENSSDFVYLQIPSTYLRYPGSLPVSLLDPCEWSRADAKAGRFPVVQGWFHSLINNVKLHLQNIQLDHTNIKTTKLKGQKKSKTMPGRGNIFRKDLRSMQELKQHVIKYPNALPVLSLGTGGWFLKLPYLHEIIGHYFRSLYVVRDPRAWIYLMLYNSKPSLYLQKNIKQHISNIFKQNSKGMNYGCAAMDSHFLLLKKILAKPDANPVQLLAQLWLAQNSVGLKVSASLPKQNYHKVKFEDIVCFPEETARTLHNFLGIPVSPAALNHLKFATFTKLYNLGYEGDISPAKINMWKENMAPDEIKVIEETCWPVMEKMGYQRHF